MNQDEKPICSDAAAGSASDVLLTRTLALCRLAKEARLNVTHSRVLDALRSLRSIQWLHEDEFRLALRTNLASSPEEEQIFDRLFHDYWHGTIRSEEGAPFMRRTELIRGDFDQGFQDTHQEVLGRPQSSGAEESERNLDLMARWNTEAPPIARVVRELAKRLATRPSRRHQPSPQGRQVDLRRSLRKNLRNGMEIVEIARAQRRLRKTRIVMLCDVSGSMDAFNPFLLQLMFGLQKELKNSRTIVFSTQVTEITSLLRRRSVQQTLQEISAQVWHWSGGTDIGKALARLNRTVLREGSARSTVAIIISDGYDNGEPTVIAREMQALRRRVQTVVWINPMFGSQTFAVRASGMRAALPYLDYFLPAFNVQSLRVLVRELARV
jgi:uncharacterized protein with von Willebrand factor type A (vWA) domain